MKTRILPLIVVFAVFQTAAPDIQADMSIDMVRVTCLPELQYHTRENKEYTLLAEAIAHGFESFDEASRQKRLALLESYGLYLPGSKNQECRAPLQKMQVPSDMPEKIKRSVDFVRITCIPQLHYLEIETLADPVLKAAINKNSSVEETKRRLKFLETHGLYSPQNLKYTCELPGANFELVANQPPASARGMCGASPTASFSLFVGGNEWFRNVPINEGCFDRPSITSITMSTGQRGWKPDEVIVCVKERPGSEEKCHFSGATFPYYGLNNEFPITESNLRKVIGK